jgi:hypothetical protein
MAIPIVGLLAAVVTAIGGYTMFWYHRLSREEQQEADRLACEYARQLYNKALDQLTKEQVRRVYELVKERHSS